MKVLVSGINGNIGFDVCKLLLERGYDLVGIDMQTRCLYESVNYHQCDITDYKQLDVIYNLYDDIEIVIHLAALISFDNSNQNIINVNSFGTYNLAHIANKHQAQKFIYLSSIPICRPQNEILDEENFHDSPMSLYHYSKKFGEQILQMPYFSFSSIILRISSPISRNLNINTFFSKLVLNSINHKDIEIWGKGTRIQNYIDTRDIGFAIINAIKKDCSGIFFIGGESISNIDLAKKIVHMTNSRSTIKYKSNFTSDDMESWIISNEKSFRELEYNPKYHISDMIEKVISEVLQK